MVKYLRIAVTALSLTACVLLVALWMRSYSNDRLEGYLPAPDNICCRSIDGVVVALRLPAQTVTEQGIQTFTSFQFDSKPVDIGASETLTGFALDWQSTAFWWIQAPYWFLVSVATLIAAVPWFASPGVSAFARC
jgi:hypothetical protein